MLKSYVSQRLFTTETVLPDAIPAHSTIISVIVEVFTDSAGTVTLQTETFDSEIARRIIYLDDISGSGVYSGNSAKDYFISRQNLTVKITGSLEIQVKILFWEVDR